LCAPHFLDGRPPPPLKPAERGFAKTVSAASGEELADADNEVETELFGQGNTGTVRYSNVLKKVFQSSLCLHPGINFELYETIHAEATGNNVPPPITSVCFFVVQTLFSLLSLYGKLV